MSQFRSTCLCSRLPLLAHKLPCETFRASTWASRCCRPPTSVVQKAPRHAPMGTSFAQNQSALGISWSTVWCAPHSSPVRGPTHSTLAVCCPLSNSQAHTDMSVSVRGAAVRARCTPSQRCLGRLIVQTPLAANSPCGHPTHVCVPTPTHTRRPHTGGVPPTSSSSGPPPPQPTCAAAPHRSTC